MNKYTILLKSVCESLVDAQRNDSPSITISLAVPYIFDFSFPFYDETKRKDWCNRFIHHFYMYELGFETFGLWKFELENQLQLIMPKYNNLYILAQNNFSPFITENIEEIGKIVNDNSSSSKSDALTAGHSTSTDVMKHSTLPQSSIQNVLDSKYLSSADASDTSVSSSTQSNATASNTSNSSQNESKIYKGYRGFDPSKLATEYLNYQNAISGVDSLLYDECECLFMGLF